MIFSFFGGMVLLISLLNVSESDPIIHYKVDADKSKILWTCTNHFGALAFDKVDITFVDNRLTKADCSIDMTQIKDQDIDYDLMRKTFENVLKSENFFNVERYPQAGFELFAANYIKENTYEVSGDFIILDIPVCLEFEAMVKFEKDRLYFDTKPVILDRTAWGIYYLSNKNPFPKEEEEGSFFVSDTIGVEIHLQAFKI